MSKHPSISGIPLVLGGNVFGWTADRDASFEVLDAFYENGGRMIDTAEAYSAWVPGNSGGESETIIGAWMKARGVREKMRIGTKTNVMGTAGGLRPEALKERLSASLDRLQTDYVDLYYAHRDDPETPQADVASGFDALLSAGLIRESGASNFTAERLSGSLRAAKSIGVKGYGVLQNQLNLLERSEYPEALQNVCLANDIAMLPFSGLASGFLTGKYRKAGDYDKYPRGDRVRKYAEQGNLLLPVMDQIAEECEATLGQIALAWLLAQPGVAAPVASATTADQVDDLVEAMETELTPAQIEALDSAARSG